MKRGLITGLVVGLIAIAFTAVFAVGSGYGFGPGAGGSGYGPGGGFGACPYGGGGAAAVTPEQAQKFAKFQNDILPLKQRMLQLRTELMTLRAQTPTDWNAIAAKQKEMVDVRTQIQKKATESGFGGYGAYGFGRWHMGGMGMY